MNVHVRKYHHKILINLISVVSLGMITAELDEANVDSKTDNSKSVLKLDNLPLNCRVDTSISTSKMVSIIGSERCIVLHFQSVVIRDKFLKRMQCFIFQNKQSKTKPLRLPPLGSSIDVPTRSKDEIQQLSENTTSSDGSVGVDQTA